MVTEFLIFDYSQVSSFKINEKVSFPSIMTVTEVVLLNVLM